jgi:TonB family protein
MTGLAPVLSMALLHFLWQGTVVAIVLWVALLAMRKWSANARYLVSCGALAVLMLLPVATAYVLYERPGSVSGIELAGRPSEPAASARTANWVNSLQSSFEVWSVPIWCLGVLFFSARLVWGSRQVSQMRRRGEPAEEALHTAVARIAERMGITRRVSVLISAMADGPSVVGFLRPVILLPTATILGLAPEQLEAVLAHELAHIRRYDYLVNVVEMFAEALLFYHPAVWWISGRIRCERELCCDDEAVRACGDAFRYARALTALERMRVMTPSLALGGTDGPLAYRIKRLMGAAPQDSLPSRVPGLMAVCLALACLGLSVNRVRAQAQPDAPGVHVDLGSSAVIHRAPVAYPAAAQIGNIRGTVSVELHMDASGNVSDARVLSGPEELRKPVLESVLGWHFTPDAAGATRVVNVEFQAPAQEKPQAAARAAGDLNRTVQVQATTQFLKAEIVRARANLDQARALELDPDSIRAREAELRARLVGLEMRLRDTAVQKQFEGRVLRNIRLVGLDISTEDFLAHAQLPIRAGDTLTQSSIEATIAAVRKLDEHLGDRWALMDPNGIELTIFAPGATSEPVGRGARSGSGIGIGVGVGVGSGEASATNGASAPQIVYRTEPEYSDAARKAKWQGAVVLSLLVDETGKPTEIKVKKSLGMGLDEKAIEAVQKWQFKPGMKDGKPVPVAANVEVEFRLP